MKFFLAMTMALAFSGTVHADRPAPPIPSSVISDPAPDPDHPPRSAQVLVPSHGLGMNGLFYLAGGAGPHPTLVLLHGLRSARYSATVSADPEETLSRARAELDASAGSWGGPRLTGAEYVDALRGDVNERLRRLGVE